MSILNTAAKVLGTAYDYATPGLGSSRLTDWGSGTSNPSANVPSSGYKAPSTGPSANDKAIAALQAQLKNSTASYNALQAQIAAQPKLPTFDYSANYAKAQGVASSTVNPVYQDKLNQYLQKKQLGINQQTEQTTRNKEDLQTALTAALQDSATSRTRTNEDTTTQIGDVNADASSYQTQEGRQFDAARTALLGDVADAGLTESGIGQGKVQDATTDRNNASADQVRSFDNKKRDITTLANRTLEDLNTSDTRNTAGTARKSEGEDINLRNYIDSANIDENAFRATNEADRIGAVNDATNSAYSNIVAQTMAALAGSGARAQDIALFKQVYG